MLLASKGKIGYRFAHSLLYSCHDNHFRHHWGLILFIVKNIKLESTPDIAETLGTAIWCPYQRAVRAGCERKKKKMYLLDLR